MEIPASYPGFGTRHYQMLLLFLRQTVSLTVKTNFYFGLVAMLDNSVSPVVKWTSMEEGAVRSSFSWGHLVSQVPASYLAARIGPSRCIPIAMAIIGLSTLAVPMAAMHGGYIAVCFTEAITGGFQAFLFPGAITHLSKWLVPKEREKYLTIIFGGAQIGTIVVLAGGGFLVQAVGWPSIFYISGALCLGWSVLGALYLADSPDSHKTISSEERNYINFHLRDDSTTDKVKLSPPWSAMCTSVPFWALIITNLTDSWGSWILNTQTPKYLHGVFHFNMKQDGMLSALPVTCKWLLSFMIAFLADFIIKKKIMSISRSRKMWNSITQYGCCLALGLLASIKLNITTSLALLILAVSANACNYPGFMANYLDLSPNYSGILSGISSNIADVGSILAPTVASVIVVDHHNAQQWRILFIVSAVIYFIGGTIFLLFGSTKVQKWNSIKKRNIEKFLRMTSMMIFMQGGQRERRNSERGLTPKP